MIVKMIYIPVQTTTINFPSGSMIVMPGFATVVTMKIGQQQVEQHAEHALLVLVQMQDRHEAPAARAPTVSAQDVKVVHIQSVGQQHVLPALSNLVRQVNTF